MRSFELETMRVKTGKLIGVLLAAAAVGLLASAHAADPQKPTRVPLPAAKAVKGEKCVEPTEVMRRDHMQMVLHQRDDTMHQGIRTVKHSLKKLRRLPRRPANRQRARQGRLSARAATTTPR